MLIHEFELNRHSILRISKDKINGNYIGHIRIWTKKKESGQFTPTTSSITFSLKNLDDILKGLMFLKIFKDDPVYEA